MKNIKKEFIEYLNEIGMPEHEKGRCPVNANYGDWLKKNDPIAFQVGLRDFEDENFSN